MRLTRGLPGELEEEEAGTERGDGQAQTPPFRCEFIVWDQHLTVGFAALNHLTLCKYVGGQLCGCYFKGTGNARDLKLTSL